MKTTYSEKRESLVTISEAGGLCAVQVLGNETEAVDADGNPVWQYDVAEFEFTPGRLLVPAMVQANPAAFLLLRGNVDQLAQKVTDRVQRYLDDAAKARGYDSCASACGYLDSSVPMFAAEARILHTLRDDCWLHMRRLQAAAVAGDAEAMAALLTAPQGLPVADFSAVPCIE